MRHYFSCKECVDLLLDFLEGNLDPETTRRLDEHLSACPPCLNFLKSYRACTDMVHGLKDQQVEIPIELEQRLKGFLKEQITKP